MLPTFTITNPTVATRNGCGMRKQQPVEAARNGLIEQAGNQMFEETNSVGRSDDTESQATNEVEHRTYRERPGPEYFEHQVLLAEVAGLIADGLDPDEEAELVGVEIQGKKLPSRLTYTPSPASIEASCRDVQSTWSDAERRQRNKRPAERWELIEASAAELSSEIVAFGGLLG